MSRPRIGVLVPSPNTATEAAMALVSPREVTLHYSRMLVEGGTRVDSDASHADAMARVHAAIEPAARALATMKPAHVVLAIGAPAFERGIEGEAALASSISRCVDGVGVTTAGAAFRRALESLGARRLALLTPYRSTGSELVAEYFEQAGFTVVRRADLDVPDVFDLAALDPGTVARPLMALDGDDVDAILQVGANLDSTAVAAALELVIDKPVLGVNAVLLWDALVACGVRPSYPGMGRLLQA